MAETENKKKKKIFLLTVHQFFFFIPLSLGMLLNIGIFSQYICWGQENQESKSNQETTVDNSSGPAPSSPAKESSPVSTDTDTDEEKNKANDAESKKETEEDQPIKVKPQPLIVNPPQRLKSNTSRPSGIQKRSAKSKIRNEKKSTGPESNAKEDSKEKSKGQWGVVQTDGAAVYKAPNFDATIIDYVSVGKKVRISQKIFVGNGGFGAFYRVKVSPKVLGYIADVDIKPEFKNREPSSTSSQNKKLGSLTSANEEESLPVFYTRFFGVTYGTLGFAEKLSGQRFSSQEWMTGFRLAGPGALMEGVPLDLSVLFHVGVPHFYAENITSGSPTGYFVLADIFLPFPFKESRNFLLSWGLGLMSVYTRFNLQVRNTIFDSQELRMGLAAQLGGTYRWNRYALRVEGKYFYEKSDYFGLFGTFMLRY